MGGLHLSASAFEHLIVIKIFLWVLLPATHSNSFKSKKMYEKTLTYFVLFYPIWNRCPFLFQVADVLISLSLFLTSFTAPVKEHHSRAQQYWRTKRLHCHKCGLTKSGPQEGATINYLKRPLLDTLQNYRTRGFHTPTLPLFIHRLHLFSFLTAKSRNWGGPQSDHSGFV